MFKRGDIVICVKSIDSYLVVGKRYKVMDYYINLDHIRLLLDDYSLFYPDSLFVLDVKYIRKKKLKRFHQGENDLFFDDFERSQVEKDITV